MFKQNKIEKGIKALVDLGPLAMTFLTLLPLLNLLTLYSVQTFLLASLWESKIDYLIWRTVVESSSCRTVFEKKWLDFFSSFACWSSPRISPHQGGEREGERSTKQNVISISTSFLPPPLSHLSWIIDSIWWKF